MVTEAGVQSSALLSWDALMDLLDICWIFVGYLLDICWIFVGYLLDMWYVLDIAGSGGLVRAVSQSIIHDNHMPRLRSESPWKYITIYNPISRNVFCVQVFVIIYGHVAFHWYVAGCCGVLRDVARCCQLCQLRELKEGVGKLVMEHTIQITFTNGGNHEETMLHTICMFIIFAYLANLYLSVDAPGHEWGLDLDEPSSWREQSEKEAMAYYGCMQRYAKSIKVLKVLWNNCATDVMSEVGSWWIQIPSIP